MEWVDCSGDVEAYFRALCALWAAAEDFLIVEHDMVPTLEAVQAMDGCPKWWCVNPYGCNEWGTLVEVAFGFTRFRRQLMEAEPDAMEATVEISDVGAGLIVSGGQRWPARHFQGLDCRFDRVLGGRGYRQHAHDPPIEHLHDYRR